MNLRLSDSPSLAWAAAVMGQWCNVFDGTDVQAGGLEGTDGGFAAASGPFNFHFNLFDAKFLSLIGAGFSGALGGKRSALATPLESTRTSRRPAQHVAVGIGDRHDCIVERRLDVSDRPGHVASDLPTFGLCHGLPLS